MKRLRAPRWSGQLLSRRTRPSRRLPQHHVLPCCSTSRYQSTAAALSPDSSDASSAFSSPPSDSSFPTIPSSTGSIHSAKLAALHARLALSSKLPLSTLHLALLDPTASPTPRNNASLSVLGNNLLGYHLSEHLLCHYPRLPMPVLWAAMAAYVGPSALMALAKEWGVEWAAEPGEEVDKGLLQFRHLPPGSLLANPAVSPSDGKKLWRRGISSRIITDNEFGEAPSLSPSASNSSPGTTLEMALTNFTRALLGAIYLHAGRAPTKSFISAHILSRSLSLPTLFSFRQPTRDLSRLCAREGFAAPVARLVSETGRRSRHPVFVVGVFSGEDKLGEGSGASLDEARNRAAVQALMGWYLYSPSETEVPSDVDGSGAREWRGVMIDGGEIVV
ncbi:MAG: hypothetical protein M1817_003305 [Caeruleum heppii]|nr:MAG: hypothetical protein M1817_003305 [Caeruleum heppii]